MIVEHALLSVRPGLEAEFEQAFADATGIIAASPGFRSVRLSRRLEPPGAYLLVVEWDSLQDHTVGFRGSMAYDRWKELLHRFYDPRPRVEHFEPRHHRASPATVHLLCGLNGAGKTTLARHLELSLPAARFTLDAWMIRLHPGVGIDSPDYGPLAEVCKQLLGDSAVGALRAGTDVILDWNQWNRVRRSEWAHRARGAGFDVVLHHLTTPLATAIERARSRTANGSPESHALAVEEITHLAGIFEKPDAGEGLRLVVHEP